MLDEENPSHDAIYKNSGDDMISHTVISPLRNHDSIRSIKSASIELRNVNREGQGDKSARYDLATLGIDDIESVEEGIRAAVNNIAEGIKDFNELKHHLDVLKSLTNSSKTDNVESKSSIVEPKDDQNSDIEKGSSDSENKRIIDDINNVITDIKDVPTIFLNALIALQDYGVALLDDLKKLFYLGSEILKDINDFDFDRAKEIAEDLKKLIESLERRIEKIIKTCEEKKEQLDDMKSKSLNDLKKLNPQVFSLLKRELIKDPLGTLKLFFTTIELKKVEELFKKAVKSVRSQEIANLLLSSSRIKVSSSDKFKVKDGGSRIGAFSCAFIAFYFLSLAALFGSLIFYYLYESCALTSTFAPANIQAAVAVTSFNTNGNHICAAFIPSTPRGNSTGTDDYSYYYSPTDDTPSEFPTPSPISGNETNALALNSRQLLQATVAPVTDFTFNRACLLEGLSCDQYGHFYPAKCERVIKCDSNTVKCSSSTSDTISVQYISCSNLSTALVNSIQYCVYAQTLIAVMFIIIKVIYKDIKARKKEKGTQAICDREFCSGLIGKVSPLVVSAFAEVSNDKEKDT